MAWPPPWLDAPEQSAAEASPERRTTPGAARLPSWSAVELAEEREHVRALQEPSDEREHESRARLREDGAAGERAAGAGAANRLLSSEEQAILELIGEWAPIDRSYRKLAHRGSYIGLVFASPSTVQRIALKHGVTVPGQPPRPPRRKLVFPDVPWERNRIWMWDASAFPTAGRIAYAIVDVVTRYWLGYLLASEGSSTEVQGLYASAAREQGLESAGTRGGDRGPILATWSDSGEDVTPTGRPTRHAQIESFFGHLRTEWPQLTLPTDPDTLDQELARIRDEYNTVRLHSAVGYVTPSDEHEGRGPQVRAARDAGLRHARAERIRHNRTREP
jgi:putative transposase